MLETRSPSPTFRAEAFALPLHNGVHAGFGSFGGHGLRSSLGGYLRTILDNEDSAQIFYFLSLNLSYMFVQMIYGIWTNSLGLISDAIHMFFDCLALGVGLFAAIMSRWPANEKFTYGYSRVETLSGFTNGIFLVLISIFILFEAIARLFNPPEMNTDRLLLVSFVGLVVNLVGVFVFNHGHGHGHGHGHSHGHGHGHSHSHGHGYGHGHSHEHSSHGYGHNNNNNHHHNHHHHHHNHHYDHGDNANMEGIYLHVLADTMGSIGVIVSTILIEQFGWTGFDPIASIFIAVLIFMSVLPLLKNSTEVLMLSIPDDVEITIDEALQEMSQIPGATSYRLARFWPNDGGCLIGSIHIQVEYEANAQHIATQVTHVLQSRIKDLDELTVQVEKQNGFSSCFCVGSDSNSFANFWGHKVHE